MDYCVRCGHYFLRKSGRWVTRAIGARGSIIDPCDSICPRCRTTTDEMYSDGIWRS